MLKAEAGATLEIGSLAAYSGMTSGKPFWQLGGAGNGDLYSPLQNGYNNNLNSTNALLKDGAGTWTLWATNTYIGGTTISNGTLVVNGGISGGGAAGNGPLGVVYVDCNVYPPATLRGSGWITQAVTNYGIFAPGTVSSIGTMAISNRLQMLAGSTNVFRVQNTGVATCDQVIGITTVIEGGDLKITLLPGTLIGGEVFKLFSATTYVGSFATIELPTIPSPLTWDTTHLAADGTLRVNGTLASKNIGFAAIGHAPDGNFQMNGTSTLTNWNYRIMATTNLADPASWIQAGSGAFTGGAFSLVDLGSTNYPHRFYKVIAP